MEKDKYQRQPDPPGRRSSRPGRQEHPHKGRPDSRGEPASRHETDRDTDTATSQGKPVTNHDEQRRVTNAGNADDVMGERETEGDRRWNDTHRSYNKSSEDDFMNNQRKTPTME